MSTPTTHRTAPLWKFAEVSPSTPEFNDLTESDEVTFIPLEDVWPANKTGDFQTVAWEKRLTGYTPFRRGDLLLPKVTPTVTHGRTMITDTATELGVASTEVYTVRARPGTDPRWLAYLLVGTEFLGLAGASVQGTGGLKRISTQFVESYPLPDASPDEQRAIADYLDRETAEVDAMSADLDEMEALLTERRRNIVQSSVTPPHIGGWQRRKLGYLVTFRNGKETTGVENPEGRYPVYGSGGEFKRADDYLHDGPSVLFGRKGTVDRPLLVDGRFWTVDTMYYTEIGPEVDPKFLYYWATTAPFALLATDTALPSMTSTELSQLPVDYPDLPTQRRIADEIDRETAEIDAMLANITELRDLLAERRAAVIAAAVTGQIDVPDTQETNNG